MSTVEQSAKPALEITATLARRRFGLCGFDTGEARRVSRVLRSAGSFAMPFEERQLVESARICDGMVVKLLSVSLEGLRAAAASLAPTLVIGPSQALLEGVGAAYRWPRDFINEPWSETELLVRLFRMLESPGNSRDAVAKSRVEPLVLLADDDPDLIALVDVTLRGAGITCRTVEDGLAALQLARELGPDVIVLDIRMPKMNGFDVLETIRRDPGLQTIPVILLTGCDDISDVMRGAELRADEYLSKPVSPKRMLDRVKRLLSTRESNARQSARSLPGSSGSAERLGSLDAAGAVEGP
jgi:CheY-like chemotaxis protein